MFTTEDPGTPTFSYVGRLRDSRKGLEVFLDAIEILLSCGSRSLTVWIIGGSDEDLSWARKKIVCREQLRSIYRSRHLVLWGRIENESLPEFYSRSTALVVPSFREQFGIVGVEAMMCGCPVVASRTGGLKDIVVSGRTGAHFEPGNSASLAAILDTYCEAPGLSAWQGRNSERWARQQFHAPTVFARLEQVITGHAQSSSGVPVDPHLHEIEHLVPTTEALIGEKIIRTECLTSSQSVSFSAACEDGSKYFVKFHSTRPTYFSCLHPVTPLPSHESLPNERVALTLRMAQDLDCIPRIVTSDASRGCVVQEWIEPVRESLDLDRTIEIIQPLVGSLRDYGKHLDASIIVRLRSNLERAIADRCPAAAEAFDRVGAELHAPLFGGALRARRMHPHIELLRIKRALDRLCWLPQGYRVRANAVVDLVLGHVNSAAEEPPAFGHGSLKLEHLLQKETGQWFLCDPDHAGFYYGPVDLAHVIWNYFEMIEGPQRTKQIATALRQHVGTESERFLAVSWVLAFRLNKDLVLASRGDWSELEKSLQFLFTFDDAVCPLLD